MAEIKFPGFVGPAYRLDSYNAASQRCVNMFPELHAPNQGKDGQVAFLRSTPGNSELIEVGAGPIRLIHRDGAGRILVVSGDGLFRMSKENEWEMSFGKAGAANTSDVDQATEITAGGTFSEVGHGFHTGLRVTVASSGTLPSGFTAGVVYYVIYIDDDNFAMANTLQRAIDGLAIAVPVPNTGTFTTTQYQDVLTTSGMKRVPWADIDFTNDSFELELHDFMTGDAIQVGRIGLPMPAVFDTASTFYAIADDYDNFRLATSPANAAAGTAVNVTDPTTGEWDVNQYYTDEVTPVTLAAFGTSSGTVKAASSYDSVNGGDSTTIFTDGALNYILTANNAVYNNYGVLNFGQMGTLNGDISTDPGPISTHIVYVDGYFVLNEVDSNRFWVSDLGGFNIDSLSFASSEGDPDKILGLMVNHRDLWVLNEQSTEVYVNTGNADFPFERVQSGFIETGCFAKYSIAKVQGHVCWLGASKDGKGVVYAARGLQPQRISTHAIEQEIASYANPEDCTSWTYEDDGHHFYVLNFAEATWVYDLATQMWHERAVMTNGRLLRHYIETHAYDITNDLHLVGDQTTNKVYTTSDDVYTDDGAYIARIRVTPFVVSNLKRMFCSFFQVDMETGVGLLTGQGDDPEAMLDWSDDGGHTWSDENWKKIGKRGKYDTRLIWRRLGQFRQRVFRLKITDPVKVTIFDAILDIKKGPS